MKTYHHQTPEKMRRAERRHARQQAKTMAVHVDDMIDAYLSEECTLAGVASGMGLTEAESMIFIQVKGLDVCERCKFIIPAGEVVEIPHEGFCHYTTYEHVCQSCSDMIVTA